MNATTFERLQTIVARDFPLARGPLVPETTLAGLSIDSLGIVELLWNVEDEFKIKLPPDPQGLDTLADVVLRIDALVARQRLAASAGAPAAAHPPQAR